MVQDQSSGWIKPCAPGSGTPLPPLAPYPWIRTLCCKIVVLCHFHQPPATCPTVGAWHCLPQLYTSLGPVPKDWDPSLLSLARVASLGPYTTGSSPMLPPESQCVPDGPQATYACQSSILSCLGPSNKSKSLVAVEWQLVLSLLPPPSFWTCRDPCRLECMVWGLDVTWRLGVEH